MYSIGDIKDRLNEVQTLQGLVSAYEEISSIRMKKTRDSVLTNRSFQDEIDEIFDQLRMSYVREIANLAKKRNKRKKKSRLVKIFKHVVKSEEIRVYYGKFKIVILRMRQNFLFQLRLLNLVKR